MRDNYLYFQCYDHMWRVDLTNLQKTIESCSYFSDGDEYDDVEDEDEFQQERSPDSPFEPVVNFRKENAPITMVPFTVDEKLYMVGGIKLKPGICGAEYIVSPDFFAVDSDHGRRGFNDKVFSLEPNRTSSNPPCLFSLVPLTTNYPIPPMKATKCYPIAVTFENKSYVFAVQRFSTLPSKKLESPSFEVYDHRLRVWESLPEPPTLVGLLCSYFFFKRTLYVRGYRGFIYYEIDTRKWTSIYYTKPGFLHTIGLGFMDPTTGQVAEYDGFVVAYGCKRKLVSFNSTDDRIQVLDELEPLFTPPISNGLGHVFHLGDGKMCFVLVCNVFGNYRKHLRIATFQFKPCGQSVILSDHVFTNRKIPFHLLDLHNIFVMKEQSRKRYLTPGKDDVDDITPKKARIRDL